MKKTIVSVDEWRSTIAKEMSPLNIYAEKNDGFEVALQSRRTIQTRLLTVLGTPQHFMRTSAQVRDSAEPHFSLALQLAGEGYIAQNGNEGVLRPGDFCLFDWTVPHTRVFQSNFSMFTMMFPQRLLPIPPRLAASICGSPISGSEGLGVVASTLLRTLSSEDINLTSAPGANVVHSAIQVVSGAISEAFDHSIGTDNSGRNALASELRRHILENLEDPNLSPDTVAASQFISTRKLHKIFQEEGTSVAAWIRERRLERICRDLEDPLLRHLPLIRIASKHGMPNPAQFARAFKSVYGRTPSAYREQASYEADFQNDSIVLKTAG